MISTSQLNFAYRNSDELALKRVSLEIDHGSFVLVCGPTGSGKTTFLKTLNGLAPSFTGGLISGEVRVADQEVVGLKPHDLAHVVGYVNQQPDSAFIAQTVEDELVFGMEQLGIGRAEMIDRVSAISKELNLGPLLERKLNELSGGQQQLVAIGAAIAGGQRVLLLDEPTSALDDESTLATLSLLKDLCQSLDMTVLIAEHRFERVMPFIDSVVVVNKDGTLTHSSPVDFQNRAKASLFSRHPSDAGEVVFEATNLEKKYGNLVALQPTSVRLRQSRVIGLSGANGSGKSTLLWQILERAWKETISVGMIPQNASDLLFLDSVSAELQESDKMAGVPENSTSRTFEELLGRVDPKLHPRDLSAGQQLGLALSVQLVKPVELVLLDEPTRGLDAESKSDLVRLIDNLAKQGKAIVVASHDKEFLEACSDRIFEISHGLVLGGEICA